MAKPLLIEIGCEELPDRVVADLARQFKDKLDTRLAEAGLAAVAGTAHWTPRRLVYDHPAVAEVQPVREEEVTGPPLRIAVAPDGSYTAQARGFAAKNNADVAQLFHVKSAKGEYLAIKRTVGGIAAAAILLELIPNVLHELELPRSMAWRGPERFLRPIRWLVALHGDQPIPFRFGDLSAGPVSRGHRSLSRGEFRLASAADFPRLWEQNFVVAQAEVRRQRILEACRRVLPPELRVRGDRELESRLVNLVEWPDVILGEFEPAYLETLPAEVLVTVMRDHQKYFAVEEASGSLAPFFVAVINQQGDADGLIRHGNERVLRARFRDARFFWDSDRKQSLASRLHLLRDVTFQVKLGSYWDKSQRLRALAAELASGWKADAQVAATAAELAKCDLTTEMVKEFTELQGIMGGHYARAEGMPEAVAVAIADQYVWDRAPRSREAAAVSVADKLDTIRGMFSIGEIPSGSADPFALRRQANGIIRAVIELELPFSLQAASGGIPAVAEFLQERLAFYLRENGVYSADTVNAVLAAGGDDPLDAARRCRAVAAAPDLAAVGAVVKRAGNIVRKEKWASDRVNPELLTAPAERDLHEAVSALPAGADYAAELAAIAGLAPALERFFNEVRVNDENPVMRANRLDLLAWTIRRLARVADFSR